MTKFDLETFKALQASCHRGETVIVQFTRAIEQTEMIAEEGQKAQVINCYPDDPVIGDLWTIRFDYSAFKEFNEKLDKHQYYDKNGVARLSAKEAGFDVPSETWCFGVDEEIPYKIA